MFFRKIYLSIFTPHNLSATRNKAKLADIYFEYCSLYLKFIKFQSHQIVVLSSCRKQRENYAWNIHSKFLESNVMYLCDNAQICVHGTWRVLLDTYDGKTEGGFEFGMRHMSLIHPQPHRPDESLKLWRLSGEVIPDKRHFGNHPLPTLPLCFTRL